MKYELESITDIFNKIPTDRVEIFMKELTDAVLQAKLTIDVARFIEPDFEITQAKPFIWDDDDKGEVMVTVSLDNIGKIITKRTIK